MPTKTWACHRECLNLERIINDDLVQNYDPLHSWPLSTLVSALPVVTLFFALVVLKTAGVGGGPGGAADGRVLAIVVFGMPRAMVAAAGGLGVIFGLLRIAWIIVASIFLYNVAVETGPVPGDEGIDRGAVDRQAAATDPDRLLLRGVPGRHRRRRGAGGDRRLVPDRPGLRPVPGGDALPAGQHGAGGLGGRRQPDPHAGDRHRAARAGPQRHDRADPAPAVGDPAALAGPQHGRLARDPRGLAGPGRQRPLVRGDAVLLVELPGIRAGRHRRRAVLAGRDGRLPQGLAAGTILENPAGSDEEDATSHPDRRDPTPLGLGGAQGLVAVPAGLGAHLRLGAAAGRPAT